MALSIDQPPFYNPITKSSGNIPPLTLADLWNNWFSTFFQTISGYLSQNGIFVPQLTTAERSQITSPVNGQLIYNTDTNNFQGFSAGSWVNL